MFDVEQDAGETYGVQIAPDDPRRLQVSKLIWACRNFNAAWNEILVLSTSIVRAAS